MAANTRNDIGRTEGRRGTAVLMRLGVLLGLVAVIAVVAWTYIASQQAPPARSPVSPNMPATASPGTLNDPGATPGSSLWLLVVVGGTTLLGVGLLYGVVQARRKRLAVTK